MKKSLSAILLASILLLTLFHPSIIKIMSKSSKTSPLNTVYFAGGCFWCMEPVFDQIPGVVDTISGYMGGSQDTANYKDVSSGTTKHLEVIKVVYNTNEVSYRTLIDAFWRSIDPTDEFGQFADKGPHYQTAVFINNDKQKTIAESSKQALISLNKFTKPIVTKFLPESPFYPAEDYHQNYYQKNSTHYNAYKIGSGRDGFIKKTWAPDN